MATKSKLEQAVERQATSLTEAQRKLVMSQLKVYMENNARLTDIKANLASVDKRPAATLEEVRAKQADRSALSVEYNQLATANKQIADGLFKFLEEK